MPRWWLFLALTGRRIEEAIGLKPDDLGSDNMLHIRRVIYNGRMEELDEEQLPLDAPEHRELVERLRSLGIGPQWVFCSRRGTPQSGKCVALICIRRQRQPA